MRNTHSGDMTPAEAVRIQKALKERVDISPLDSTLKVVAGAYVSFERSEKELLAGIVLLSYPELVPVGHAVHKAKVSFPHIPGLSSFREIPALMKCIEKLKVKPDLVIVDGQGIAHLCRLGTATHLGIVSGVPTIGCAKSVSYGVHSDPESVGDASPLADPVTRETLGYVYKSKDKSNPIVISPGHRVSVGDALNLVTACVRGYRLPEPIRLAHLLVDALREGEVKRQSEVYIEKNSK